MCRPEGRRRIYVGSGECAVLPSVLCLCGIGQSAECVSEKQAVKQNRDAPHAAVYATLGDNLAMCARCLQGWM